MPDESLAAQLDMLAESGAKEKKKATNPNEIARAINDVNQLIYVTGIFHIYKRGVYVPLSEDELKVLVKEHMRDDFRSSKFKEVKECLIADRLAGVNEINNFGDRINVSNGVLNLDSRTLDPHSPDDLFTIQLAVKYDYEADCHRWIKFLYEMLGDEEQKIDALQEYAGYCLDYKTNNEKILFLLGRGANGKSVCTDVLKTVFGESSYSTISLDDFKNAHYIAMIFGKLVNISTESNSRAEVYESMLKRIASGEEVVVDRKYGHPFKFKPSCKQIYAINELPRVSDKTTAFFRRIIPIPFNRTIEEDRRISKLGEIIGREEGPGVFNWCLEGLKRLRRKGFTHSGQVAEQIDIYKRENNNVLDFIDEECGISEVGFETIKDLYVHYVKYCKDSGTRATKKRRFIKEVLDNYGAVRRSRVSGFKGLEGVSINMTE